MKNSANLGNAQRNGFRSRKCAVRAARGQVGRGGSGADIAFRSEFGHSRRARTTTNDLDKPVPHSRISSTVYAGSLYGRSPVRHRLRAQSSRRTTIRANTIQKNPATRPNANGFVFGSYRSVRSSSAHGTADLILISGHVSGASCVRDPRAACASAARRRRTCGYGFR
jgi:hypothetical protein